MQYFANISSKIASEEKNELNEMIRSDRKKILTRNPTAIGAYGGRVTDGNGDGNVDGNSICLKHADTSDSKSVSGTLRFYTNFPDFAHLWNFNTDISPKLDNNKKNDFFQL